MNFYEGHNNEEKEILDTVARLEVEKGNYRSWPKRPLPYLTTKSPLFLH